jgi:hypothetical protein
LYGGQRLTHTGSGIYKIDTTLVSSAEHTVNISEDFLAEPIIIETEAVGDGWYWLHDGQILECKFKVEPPPTEYHTPEYILIGDKIVLDFPDIFDSSWTEFEGYFDYECPGTVGRCIISREEPEPTSVLTLTIRLEKEEAPDFFWIVNNDGFQSNMAP